MQLLIMFITRKDGREIARTPRIKGIKPPFDNYDTFYLGSGMDKWFKLVR